MPVLRLASLTLLSLLAFAANSLLCRLALRDGAIDAASFTAIRIAAGAIVLLLIVRAQSQAGASMRCAGSWVSALALFGYAAMFSYAYLSLSAATGALLLFGMVQVTMIGYALWKGERLRAWQVLGLLVAMGGLVVLLLPGLEAPPLGGALLMAASGICWGIYSLRAKGAGDPTAVTAGNFLRALPMALLLPAAALFGPALHVGLEGVLYAVLSGALASGVGYALWYAVLPVLRASSAATLQLSVPLLAAAGGALLLGEPLTLRLLAAAAAIVGGIALVLIKPRGT